MLGRRLKVLTEIHYPELYRIHVRADRFPHESYESFEETMRQRTGFTVLDDKGEKIIGTVNFGSYDPGVSIAMHLFIDPAWQGKTWGTPEMYRAIMDYPFEDLRVERITGIFFEEIRGEIEPILLRSGFKYEGTIRKGAKWRGEFHNVVIFGLLREERKV